MQVSLDRLVRAHDSMPHSFAPDTVRFPINDTIDWRPKREDKDRRFMREPAAKQIELLGVVKNLVKNDPGGTHGQIGSSECSASPVCRTSAQ